jgi:hypothetical protein
MKKNYSTCLSNVYLLSSCLYLKGRKYISYFIFIALQSIKSPNQIYKYQTSFQVLDFWCHFVATFYSSAINSKITFDILDIILTNIKYVLEILDKSKQPKPLAQRLVKKFQFCFTVTFQFNLITAFSTHSSYFDIIMWFSNNEAKLRFHFSDRMLIFAVNSMECFELNEFRVEPIFKGDY